MPSRSIYYYLQAAATQPYYSKKKSAKNGLKMKRHNRDGSQKANRQVRNDTTILLRISIPIAICFLFIVFLFACFSAHLQNLHLGVRLPSCNSMQSSWPPWLDQPLLTATGPEPTAEHYKFSKVFNGELQERTFYRFCW